MTLLWLYISEKNEIVRLDWDEGQSQRCTTNSHFSTLFPQMWVLRITIGNFMETKSLCHTNIDPDKMSIYGYLYIKVYMYDLWIPFMYDKGVLTHP
jgi:hypothetical protein